MVAADRNPVLNAACEIEFLIDQNFVFTDSEKKTLGEKVIELKPRLDDDLFYKLLYVVKGRNIFAHHRYPHLEDSAKFFSTCEHVTQCLEAFAKKNRAQEASHSTTSWASNGFFQSVKMVFFWIIVTAVGLMFLSPLLVSLFSGKPSNTTLPLQQDNAGQTKHNGTIPKQVKKSESKPAKPAEDSVFIKID